MSEIVRQNLFFDMNRVNVPFLGKFNYAFLSISSEQLQIIIDYENEKIKQYGDSYKSIIVDRVRPLIKVKYDQKTKLCHKQEEVPFVLEKRKYNRTVLQAKNVYVNDDVVTTHWRIQYMII